MTPEQGRCTPTEVQIGDQQLYECAIGDLAAAASVNIVAEFSADVEGSADFEFSVDIDPGSLLELNDPDLSNNTFSATVILIDEVIIVVIGKGDGSGSVGALEVLLLLGAVVLVMMMRRRWKFGTTFAAILYACQITGQN